MGPRRLVTVVLTVGMVGLGDGGRRAGRGPDHAAP
jgi:hypothetical protein